MAKNTQNFKRIIEEDKKVVELLNSLHWYHIILI